MHLCRMSERAARLPCEATSSRSKLTTCHSAQYAISLTVIQPVIIYGVNAERRQLHVQCIKAGDVAPGNCRTRHICDVHECCRTWRRRSASQSAHTGINGASVRLRVHRMCTSELAMPHESTCASSLSKICSTSMRRCPEDMTCVAVQRDSEGAAQKPDCRATEVSRCAGERAHRGYVPDIEVYTKLPQQFSCQAKLEPRCVSTPEQAGPARKLAL